MRKQEFRGRIIMRKGQKMTPEQCRRISAGKLGKPNGRLGVRHTPETRKAIAVITKDRTARGARHYAWKGGTKEVKHGDRGTPAYRMWRAAVFERDGYMCTICTVYPKNSHLEAHHCKPYAEFPEFRYDVNNGLTLCEYHHQREVHDRG